MVERVAKMNVASVNERYIFYNDGTCERATSEKLKQIRNDTIRDEIFYSRMYKELDQMYAKAKLNLDYGRPATDRDNYFERVGAISGIADIMKEADKKKFHAIQIETQCRIALGIERSNFNEMYPEIIFQKNELNK